MFVQRSLLERAASSKADTQDHLGYRQRSLQLWLRAVVNHPLLRRSPFLFPFLTSYDEYVADCSCARRPTSPSRSLTSPALVRCVGMSETSGALAVCCMLYAVCCAVLYAELSCAVLWSALLCCTALCCAVLRCAVLCCEALPLSPFPPFHHCIASSLRAVGGGGARRCSLWFVCCREFKLASQSRIRGDPAFGPLADPVEHRRAAATAYALDYRAHSVGLRSDALHSAIAQMGAWPGVRIVFVHPSRLFAVHARTHTGTHAFTHKRSPAHSSTSTGVLGGLGLCGTRALKH